MDDELPQKLRSDARDNRDRVLAAARSLFAERGLGVSMREIARRARVGPATLYRRFPTKQALIDEAFTDELRACAAIVRDGCADPDPWRGLRSIVSEVTELNAGNQGFVDAFTTARPGAVDFAAHRASLLRSLTGLFRRAREAGALRDDVVLDDLLLMLLAGRGLPTEAARRFAALAVEAFRAGPVGSPLPPPAQLSRRLGPELIRAGGTPR